MDVIQYHYIRTMIELYYLMNNDLYVFNTKSGCCCLFTITNCIVFHFIIKILPDNFYRFQVLIVCDSVSVKMEPVIQLQVNVSVRLGGQVSAVIEVSLD